MKTSLPLPARAPAHRVPPTVADVARLAEVSPATVSRAFNAPQLLDERTLGKVQQAAGQLGYQPYGLARSLRSRRSMVVGMVIPSLSNTYFAGTLALVQNQLAKAGYTVLLSSSNYQPTTELEGVQAMAAQGVDAVVVLGRPLHDDTLSWLQHRGMPHLQCWSAPAGEPAVAFDHEAGYAHLTRHLLDLGHRRFAVIMPFQTLGERHRGRLTAIREALAQADIALPASSVVEDGGLGMAAGREAWRALRTRGRAPTAVLCSNDMLAAGVVTEIRAQGLRVPQDVSVTGYNATDMGRAFDPSITSVQTPMDLHATAVTSALLDLLQQARAVPVVRLPTELVVGASTGPAPRRR